MWYDVKRRKHHYDQNPKEADDTMKDLKDYIRTIPDFPQEGIMFRDITPLIQDPDGLQLAVDSFLEELKDVEFDLVVGPESRGFIFGVPVAYAAQKGFVPARKKGKLPWKTESVSYELEYGSTEIEIHADAIKPGQKVVIVDDLLATGGTIEAVIRLIEKLGGEVVKLCFLIELDDLRGFEKVKQYRLGSMMHY